FGKTELPRRAGVLDRRPWRRARATIMAGYGHVIGFRLGHTGCNRAHPILGNQFDADGSAGVRVLQVMNQLREIFDRIDIVMRWRRNQADSGNREAQLRDVFGNLVPRQLPAFTRLGALCHLDLDLVRAIEILCGHPEAARCDLFDLGAQGIALEQRDIALDPIPSQTARQRFTRVDGGVPAWILAALAGIGFSADAVHGDGECGMRFGRNRSQRHCASGEASYDLLGGLDFFDGYRLRGIYAELEQSAQRHMPLRLVVDDFRIVPERLETVRSGGMLQFGYGFGCPHVFFATQPESIFSTGIQCAGQDRIVAESRQVQAYRLFGNLKNADTLDIRRRPGEIFVDHPPGKADGFEYLCAGIGHIGGDAHFGHHFHQSLADRLDVVLYALLAAILRRNGLVRMENGLHRHAGMYRFRSITREQREVVHFTSRPRLDHQTRTGTQTLAYQMLVYPGQCQQRRNGHVPGIDLAIRYDQDAVPGSHSVFGLRAQTRQPGLDRLLAPGNRIGDVDLERLELATGVVINVADGIHLIEIEHRLPHFQAHRRIGLVDAQQIGFRANKGHQRHHQIFAYRVDRRIGNLREQLLEIVV